MNQEDIQKVEDFLKTKKAAKTIQNSFDEMKKKLTEYDKYKIIKEDLGESQYAKIFETAIKNVELEKELEFSKNNNVIVDSLWYTHGPAIHWIGGVAMMTLFVGLMFFLQKNTTVEQNSNVLKKLLEKQEVIMQKLNIKDK